MEIESLGPYEANLGGQVFQSPVEKLFPEAFGKPLSRGLWKNPSYIWSSEFGFHKHGYAIRKRSKLIDKYISGFQGRNCYGICR